jgi:hypothetical protein
MSADLGAAGSSIGNAAPDDFGRFDSTFYLLPIG